MHVLYKLPLISIEDTTTSDTLFKTHLFIIDYDLFYKIFFVIYYIKIIYYHYILYYHVIINTFVNYHLKNI